MVNRADVVETAPRGARQARAGALENDDRMPPMVRRAVLAALVTLLAGAGLIVAVRGPAILIDLAATASRWLCL